MVLKMVLTVEENIKRFHLFFDDNTLTLQEIEDKIGLPFSEAIVDDTHSYFNSDYVSGQCGLTTCSKNWRINKLAKNQKGNLRFWQGVANCFLMEEDIERILNDAQ